MKIQFNNYFGVNQTPNISSNAHRSYAVTKPLANDSFELRSNSPVFGSEKINRKETKRVEQILKNIDGLHDPYSDVIMISQKRYKQFKQKLDRRTNAESTIALLSNYTEHMFPSDKKVFELLKAETAEAKRNGNQNITFTDILQKNLPEAKIRLANDQLAVTDKIRKYSRKHMKREDREYVNLYLAIIDKDIQSDTFRIKSSVEMLRRLEKEISDKEAVKEIIKITKDFPNTSTSFDAFIVKNCNKSQKEIADLLISPSQVSIEHIKVKSKHGESKASNYLVASRRMNNYRKSLPLPELIEQYPKIPMQTQRYFDELISRVNRGGLSDIAPTLPDVKESLYEESKGLIDVDLSELNPAILEKNEKMKTTMKKLMEHFHSKKKQK